MLYYEWNDPKSPKDTNRIRKQAVALKVAKKIDFLLAQVSYMKNINLLSYNPWELNLASVNRLCL